VRIAILGALALFLLSSPSSAAEDVRLLHALDPAMAAQLERLATEYNASQQEFRVVLAGVPETGPGRLQRFALPMNTARPVLYYNRDALRRARLDPAALPRTWYDLPPMLSALAAAGERCPYTTSWPAWVVMENSGGVFSRQLMVRWTSILATWEKAGWFSYSGRADEGESRFASGECAMATGSSASRLDIARRARIEVGVAPLPYYDDAGVASRELPVNAPAVWAERQSVGVTSFFAYLASQAAASRRQRDAMEAELEAVWRGGKTALDALEAMRPKPKPPPPIIWP
jgi:sn-glycerol 3-phosphate transport system substrate-binding protein